MATDKPLLNFYVDPELLKRIDDFHHKHKFKNRATAIKWLLDAGLKAKLSPEVKDDVPTPKKKSGGGFIGGPRLI